MSIHKLQSESHLFILMEHEEEYKKVMSILRDLEQSLLSDDNLTKVGFNMLEYQN